MNDHLHIILLNYRLLHHFKAKPDQKKIEKAKAVMIFIIFLLSYFLHDLGCVIALLSQFIRHIADTCGIEIAFEVSFLNSRHSSKG